MSELEERVEALEMIVRELSRALLQLAEGPAPEDSDRLQAGFARFIARGKTEGGNTERP